ncbi:hypothetical protein TEA_015470 [Camellia sinensis var. sinensis]|uniref:Uncharacterized protein n=1 Tax=Camellia sinensis var. sinensis TaxID=542762 RepID=A0A4S4E3T0_CAMSN|nr:hypothetical protein TEA_015470 [Camellia sinensis var. sinensis]
MDLAKGRIGVLLGFPNISMNAALTVAWIGEKTSDDIPMPTYFRFLALLAFKIFAAEQVDVAILEVGLGGKFDATNVVQKPIVCGITSLGYDHMEILGGSCGRQREVVYAKWYSSRPTISTKIIEHLPSGEDEERGEEDIQGLIEMRFQDSDLQFRRTIRRGSCLEMKTSSVDNETDDPEIPKAARKAPKTESRRIPSRWICRTVRKTRCWPYTASEQTPSPLSSPTVTGTRKPDHGRSRTRPEGSQGAK